MSQPPRPLPPQQRVPLLCLAGFMGSGKTTVGTLLARQLAWRFVDLDDRIESAANMRISKFSNASANRNFARSKPTSFAPRSAASSSKKIDRARARRRHLRSARRARVSPRR